MQKEAEPTQHKYSATTTASTVTSDRAKKLQEDKAGQTRHSAAVSKRSTDSVSSKGENCSDKELRDFKSALKIAITSHLQSLYELKKIFSLSDDSMPEIFCNRLLYIPPRIC